MKKSLIALAALAAVSGVQAQSSITIYGILDAGYSSKESTTTKFGGSTNTNSLVKTKTSGIAGNGAESTSRLGFRGTEDLGGGLKANFVFETALNPAEATLTAMNNRQAFVGLEGGFGVIRAGTVYSEAHILSAGFSASTLPNVVGDVMYVQSGGSLGQTFDKFGIIAVNSFAVDNVTATTLDTAAATTNVKLNNALVGAGLNNGVATNATTHTANAIPTGTFVAAIPALATSNGTAIIAAEVSGINATIDAINKLTAAKVTADLNARLARSSNISYNVRTNNTVTYMSPDMSGFRIGGQYSLPAQTKIQGGDETTSSATQLSLGYAAGKFAAAAVHTTGESKSVTTVDAVTASTGVINTGGLVTYTSSITLAGVPAIVATSPTRAAVAVKTTTVEVKTKESIAALSYDLGVAKVSYIYAKRDAKDTVSDLSEKTTHSFGVKAPFGKATAFAIYSMGDTKVLNGTSNAAKFDLDGTQMGVSYAMSKRSDIYAIYGTNKMDNKANANDIKDKQYAIGLRHQF
jgi:predicted porin